MTEKYDLVIAGAGHNSLTAAAYLAKAGLNVCVVEKNDNLGGGVATEEVAAPGFKSDICSMIHVMIQGNPLIRNDELQLLSKYGLKYIYPDKQMTIHYHDSEYLSMHLSLDNMCNSIAKFSEKDAESYRRFYDWSVQSLEMILQGVYSPPPPFGTFASVMDGSEEGSEILRALMMSPLDIIMEWFEHDRVRIAFTRWISELMMHPQTKGNGLALFLMIPLMHKYGSALPQGGSGMLVTALERCLIENGATIKKSSPITGFKVEAGECKGIILEDGEIILAEKAVITACNIKNIFPKMVPEGSVSDKFISNVERLQSCDFVNYHQDYALHDAPKYKVGDAMDDTYLVEFAPSTMAEYLEYFDGLMKGVTAHNPVVACQTIHDPTRAPEGKHTLYIYDFVPYELKDGGCEKWDDIKEEYGESLMNFLRKYTSNMGAENIIGSWTETPLDEERYNPSFIQGDFGHIGAQLWQSVGNRPLPKWNYRTPVEKLYMSSASCHPGLGVTAGAGRAAAQVVMEDLGIDFEKVIG